MAFLLLYIAAALASVGLAVWCLVHKRHRLLALLSLALTAFVPAWYIFRMIAEGGEAFDLLFDLPVLIVFMVVMDLLIVAFLMKDRAMRDELGGDGHA